MSTHRDEFTTFDIIKALGIPRERLQDWINRDFIKPTIPAEGRGTKAIFTRSDVYKIMLFQKLIGMGFNRINASTISWYSPSFIPKKHTSTGYLRMVIKYFVEEGEPAVEVERPFVDEGIGLSLKTGQFVSIGVDGSDPEPMFVDLDGQRDLEQERIWKEESKRIAEEWESVIVINLDRIVQKVDMALSGLE
jgi:hypothetical protein